MATQDPNKMLLYTSPDERYNLYQLWTDKEPHRLEDRSYGDIVLIDNTSSTVVWTIEEPARTIVKECKDPAVGWHGDYVVLLLYPDGFKAYFKLKFCYAALIDVKKGEIIQREPVYYDMFRLRYFDSPAPHLRVYSETYPEDRLSQRFTFLEDHGCRVEAEPKQTKVYFEDRMVVIPELQLIHIPELEQWSPDRRMCCFYAYYHRDVLAVIRLLDDDTVMLDAWNLEHRPSEIRWDNMFVPVVCGIEARKSPFMWDDSEYVRLRTYPHFPANEPIAKPQAQAADKPEYQPQAATRTAPQQQYVAPQQQTNSPNIDVTIKVAVWVSLFLMFGFLAGLLWLLAQ